VPRLLSTFLVLGLLGGTAAAFAVTERLKLVPSPIAAPRVTEAFSPICRCETDEAQIEFRLRDPDRLTVEIVDAESDEVATLAEDDERPSGLVRYAWDGSGADEGRYRARVHLEHARRTIVIPNETRLDVTPPALTVERIVPREFSPDGDGRADRVRAFYRVSEPASVSLHHGDDNPVRSPPRTAGKIEWYARGLLPGPYTVGLAATDLAGNSTDALAGVTTVRLRFVGLSPRRVIVPTGVRFGVRVSTDARAYRWRLGARRGTASSELLTLRAPAQAGRYTLVVSYGRHRAAIPVFVRPRP
jgi:hypothetical protein